MTINELKNNPELLAEITEDIEDFDEATDVVYEVWALGYDENDEVVDAELCMFTSIDRDEAINHAKKVTLADVVNLMPKEVCEDCGVAKIKVEVETVAPVTDEELMNIGTVYERELWSIDDEQEEPEDDDDDPDVVELTEEAYTLLEDGTLKVSCKLLKDFNKNDCVAFRFVNEDCLMTYKIISKVIYEDGDYYHCEFIY